MAKMADCVLFIKNLNEQNTTSESDSDPPFKRPIFSCFCAVFGAFIKF